VWRKGIHITNLTRIAPFLSEVCDLVLEAVSRRKQFLNDGIKNNCCTKNKPVD